ncbi:MAG: hypothetical protein R3F11_20195 [Verrucomicrobiales bacterium]
MRKAAPARLPPPHARGVFAIPTAAPAGCRRRSACRSVASPTTSAAQAAEMDAAIRDVLAAPRYEWRMDRSRGDAREEESGWLADMVRSATDAGKRGYEAAGRWIERMFGLGDAGGGSEFGGGQTMSSGTVTLMSTTVLVAVTAVLAWWLFSKRRRPAQSAPHEIAAWSGRSRIRSSSSPTSCPRTNGLPPRPRRAGRIRLAIRAFFLAGLASLGGRDLSASPNTNPPRLRARGRPLRLAATRRSSPPSPKIPPPSSAPGYGRFSPGSRCRRLRAAVRGHRGEAFRSDPRQRCAIPAGRIETASFGLDPRYRPRHRSPCLSPATAGMAPPSRPAEGAPLWARLACLG